MEALTRRGGLPIVEDDWTPGPGHEGYMAPSVDFEVLDSAMTKLGKTTTLLKVLVLGSLCADAEARARHHTGRELPVAPG